MTIAESLKMARDSLTDANWNKGQYFRYRDGLVCMCAHGAVQAIVNENVIHAMNAAATAAVTATAAEAAVTATAAEAAEAAWEARATEAAWEAAGADACMPPTSHWAMSAQLGYGAHYVMGMVGLTTNYNDIKSTKLADVKAKFDLAIALAAKLEASK